MIIWKQIKTYEEAKEYDDLEPNFSKNIDFDKGNVYMAIHKDYRYLGFIQVTEDGFIENVLVTSSKQGMGYGNIFVEKCLSLGGKKLHTNIKNIRAQNLYHKYDFRITGIAENKRYYIMEKLNHEDIIRKK